MAYNSSEFASRSDRGPRPIGDVILDGAAFEEHDGRWHLISGSAFDDEPDRGIYGDWDDWVTLANHIVAIDEILRREESGEL